MAFPYYLRLVRALHGLMCLLILQTCIRADETSENRCPQLVVDGVTGVMEICVQQLVPVSPIDPKFCETLVNERDSLTTCVQDLLMLCVDDISMHKLLESVESFSNDIEKHCREELHSSISDSDNTENDIMNSGPDEPAAVGTPGRLTADKGPEVSETPVSGCPSVVTDGPDGVMGFCVRQVTGMDSANPGLCEALAQAAQGVSQCVQEKIPACVQEGINPREIMENTELYSRKIQKLCIEAHKDTDRTEPEFARGGGVSSEISENEISGTNSGVSLCPSSALQDPDGVTGYCVRSITKMDTTSPGFCTAIAQAQGQGIAKCIEEIVPACIQSGINPAELMKNGETFGRKIQKLCMESNGETDRAEIELEQGGNEVPVTETSCPAAVLEDPEGVIGHCVRLSTNMDSTSPGFCMAFAQGAQSIGQCVQETVPACVQAGINPTEIMKSSETYGRKIQELCMESNGETDRAEIELEQGGNETPEVGSSCPAAVLEDPEGVIGHCVRLSTNMDSTSPGFCMAFAQGAQSIGQCVQETVPACVQAGINPTEIMKSSETYARKIQELCQGQGSLTSSDERSTTPQPEVSEHECPLSASGNLDGIMGFCIRQVTNMDISDSSFCSTVFREFHRIEECGSRTTQACYVAGLDPELIIGQEDPYFQRVQSCVPGEENNSLAPSVPSEPEVIDTTAIPIGCPVEVREGKGGIVAYCSKNLDRLHHTDPAFCRRAVRVSECITEFFQLCVDYVNAADVNDFALDLYEKVLTNCNH